MEDYNNTSHMAMNHSESYQPHYKRLETFLVPLICAVIFIVGVVGNIILVAVFIRNESFKNAPNTYIFSLAISDLLVIITSMPFMSVKYTLESWTWGASICQVAEAVKDVNIGVTVFNLVALSVERYIAITVPLRKLQARGGSKQITRLTVASAIGIWILAALLAIPGYVGSYVPEFDISHTKQFLATFPYPEQWRKVYSQRMVLMQFLVYYGVPLVTIALFYILMAQHLVPSTQNMPGEINSQKKQMEVRRKMAVTVFMFVIIFAVCFLPSHVFIIWFYFCSTGQDYSAWWHALRIVGFCLSFLPNCTNPIALYYTSGIFRAYFKRYLICCRSSTYGLQSSHCSSSSSRLHCAKKTNISMEPITSSTHGPQSSHSSSSSSRLHCAEKTNISIVPITSSTHGPQSSHSSYSSSRLHCAKKTNISMVPIT